MLLFFAIHVKLAILIFNYIAGDPNTAFDVIFALVNRAGNYITKVFKLQKMVGIQWVDVDIVAGNILNTADRLVTPFVARKLRLYITNSGDDDAARIYEFQLFGDVNTDFNDVTSSKMSSLIIFPNPVTSQSISVQLTG